MTANTRFAADAQFPAGVPHGISVLAGLVGKAIGLSRSPAMHEAEGAAQGLRLTYRLFDTEVMGGTNPALSAPSLAEIIRSAEICGFAGLNVTFPYKIEVLDHLDELSDAARKVGAVNTVIFRNGKRYGHNTDMWGFAESFRQRLGEVAVGRVLQTGAGGAGGAVANALLDLGVQKLGVFDPDQARSAQLVARLCEVHGQGRAELVCEIEKFVADGFDGVVNASPVGMAKHPGSPFPPDQLLRENWVADIVYFPIETPLLAAARDAGCRVMNGSGMALYQAVRAFELFTGIRPDASRMEATFAAFDTTVSRKG